ncbi:MAG TPA: hypothetical protein DIT28_00510 [Oxalobacteraceae bacterium]|nr:hypothetical protein [Oxalobacteraceae bacterium]
MSGISKPLQALPIVKHDEIGQLVGGFNQLLTTLGEREAQLKIERDFFKAVLQQSSDGVFLFDPHEGCIVEANPSICRMLGYECDEVLALNLIDLLGTAPEKIAECVAKAHAYARVKEARLLRRIESLMKHANDCIMMQIRARITTERAGKFSPLFAKNCRPPILTR